MIAQDKLALAQAAQVSKRKRGLSVALAAWGSVLTAVLVPAAASAAPAR